MPPTASRNGRIRSEAFGNRHIVVVTPVALDADSRTLKQVMSLYRWGARVTVLAGGKVFSGEDVAAKVDEKLPPERSHPKPRPHWIARPWGWVRRTQVPAVFLLPVFGVWLVHFFYRTYLRARPKIPPSADLYILHEFGHFPAVANAAKGNPIVYDAHDFYTAIEPHDQIGSFDRDLLNPFRRWLERRCVARSANVMTVSPGLAQLYWDTYGVKPVVVRNCHDNRLDAKGVADVRSRFGLAQKDFIIAIIGNWKAGQVLSPLLRVLARITDNVHLVLIGDGYERLDNEINALNLEGRVHSFGRLPASDIVPSVLNADAAAVVYYARSENYRYALPNGFFQSVAAGLPVLYPDLLEIRQIAEQRGLGLMVDWRDEQKIASAIDEIASDRRVRDRLRDGAEKAARELSWEKEELVMRKALSECLQRAALRPENASN